MGINDHTTNKLISYYNSFLLKKQDNHREKYKEFYGWFSASTAGSCHRKQYFNVNGYEGTYPDEKSMRLMRLGTIVHKDIADTFENYREEIESKGYELFVEHKVILEELNVVGHLDLGIYDKDTQTLDVTDLKTAHSYKWKKMFGRDIDKNPSVNYYLQVATYGMGLAEELGISKDNVNLSLTWYKKDDSSIRAQKIDTEWIDEATNYWTDLNVALANDSEPIVGDHNTPIYDWECKYCPYHKLHCEGI